jgi:NAD(P)-dependent dehydrogenase (short-subunit alcohol dehydrogenase family)
MGMEGGEMSLKPLEEQVVALMGTSSGIGRESALRFASRGAKVVVSARNKDGLDSLVGEIQTRSGEATAVAADVTDYEAVKAVADRAASPSPCRTRTGPTETSAARRSAGALSPGSIPTRR